MSPDLIKSIASEVYGIEPSEVRCAELAAEQVRLGNALAKAVGSLDFDTLAWSHAASTVAADDQAPAQTTGAASNE